MMKLSHYCSYTKTLTYVLILALTVIVIVYGIMKRTNEPFASTESSSELMKKCNNSSDKGSWNAKEGKCNCGNNKTLVNNVCIFTDEYLTSKCNNSNGTWNTSNKKCVCKGNATFDRTHGCVAVKVGK